MYFKEKFRKFDVFEKPVSLNYKGERRLRLCAVGSSAY